MSKKVALLTAMLVLAIGWVVFSFRQSMNSAPPGAAMNGTSAGLVGKVLEDFALKDESGKTLRLSDYRGKIVLLVFYASW